MCIVPTNQAVYFFTAVIIVHNLDHCQCLLTAGARVDDDERCDQSLTLLPLDAYQPLSRSHRAGLIPGPHTVQTVVSQ